jgi:hypothetical protein
MSSTRASVVFRPVMLFALTVIVRSGLLVDSSEIRR